MTTFEFSRAPLEPSQLAADLADPACGGYASFEGWVRNENEGRRVERLDYESFETLAIREGERIIQEAIERFGVRHARCVHRIGELGLGELAVWVGVASGHRAEAFAACRYIIDEVKHRVPIWKKEHYADGDSGWVNCERCAEAAHHAHASGHAHDHDHGQGHGHATSSPVAVDYSRQIALPEVGEAGQRRLAAASVVIVGAGGLGCPVLSYLSAAGVGTIHIVDGDVVEASNLHRQPLYGVGDIGQPKAHVAADRLSAAHPNVMIRAHATRLDAGNAAQLLALGEVVVDCTDNFRAKFLVNDAAVLARKPAVLASIHQYEGQLQVARPDRGGSCLRCVWPEATRDGLVGNCAESGVLGPVPAVLGSLQAMEVLKILLDLPGQLRDELLLIDLLGLRQTRLRAPRAVECSGAGCARIHGLPAPAPEDLELDLPLAEAARRGLRIIDIRGAEEIEAAPLPVEASLAYAQERLIAEAATLLDPSARYLVVCARGVRSLAVAERLRAAGFSAVHSLARGADGTRRAR
ncbi:MAG: ThiF family adenylyltransferase [Steroidobacteraceae bacterium]|jgi:adenylyltransferase/sulfurtransferase|nr:ThiF family adenylyltransferase [Steroidobacteraceae bacterium]